MSKCQPWMLAYVSATLLSTLLFTNGTRYVAQIVTCHSTLPRQTSNLLTAILHTSKGSQRLQAQTFGKSGCIDRPRNRIDAGSAVLVFRAPNHS